MAHATQAAVSNPALENSRTGGRALGFAIVCLGPAVFWTALLALIAWALGYTVTPAVLAGNFLAIAIFLGIVFSALIFGSKSRPHVRDI